MGLNTQFPEWMQRATDSNRAAGAQLGQNILQGLRFQQGVKQQELENRNLAEIQDANLLLARSQATIARLRAQQEALASDDAVQANGAMAGALALSTELAQSPNGYNPGNRARLYSYVAQNPFLAKTPWFKGEEEKFALAEEYQRKAELTETEIAGRMAAADMRGAQGGAPGFLGVEELVGQGVPVTEALVQVAGQSSGPGDFKIRQAAQFIPATVTAMRRAGIPVEDNEVLAFLGDYGGGVTSMNAPPKIAASIDKEDVVARQLDNVTDRIAAFNAKYGANAFDEYVGPLDNPVFSFKTRTLPPSELSAADREARSIFQKVNQTIQNYRVGNFGTALTESETKLFLEIVSSPGFANYTSDIAGFRDNIKDALKLAIGNNKFATNIKLPVKARYLAESEPVRASTQRPISSNTFVPVPPLSTNSVPAVVKSTTTNEPPFRMSNEDVMRVAAALENSNVSVGELRSREGGGFIQSFNPASRDVSFGGTNQVVSPPGSNTVFRVIRKTQR